MRDIGLCDFQTLISDNMLCGSEKRKRMFWVKNDIHKRIRAGSTMGVEVVHPAVRIDHSSSQHPVWNQFSQKCGIDHKSVYLNFLVHTLQFCKYRASWSSYLRGMHLYCALSYQHLATWRNRTTHNYILSGKVTVLNNSILEPCKWTFVFCGSSCRFIFSGFCKTVKTTNTWTLHFPQQSPNPHSMC